MIESVIFTLDGREGLVNDILEFSDSLSLNLEIGHINNQKFSDGELCVDFINSVRGKRVYLLTSPNSSDEIIKLQLAIDAAKRGAAKEIIPILPYFPYSRQDKKDQSRGPIGAKVMAKTIEACGATSIITFDLHADQIQGFFDIPVTHIEGKNVFSRSIWNIADEDTILLGPDAGSGKRVKRMKDQLSKYFGIDVNYVMMDKTRTKANEIDKMVIIGDVSGKNVIILDDMVDTAGTLCKAAQVIMENGAKSVRAIISHGVLSGNAYENIGKSVLSELVVSDSLPVKRHEKIRVVSVAKQLARAISATNNQQSYELIKLK